MKKLIIDLHQGWVLKQKDAPKLPAKVVEEVLVSMGLKAAAVSFTRVTIETADDTAAEEISKAVVARLTEVFEITPNDQDSLIMIREESADAQIPEQKPVIKEPEKAPEAAPAAPAPAEKQPGPAVELTALERMERLLGAEELLKVCRSISDMAPRLKARDLSHILTGRSFLFSVDDGYGLTTALKLLSQLYNELGIFDLRGDPVEMKLEAENGRSDPLDAMAKDLERAQNKLVCIDIRNWMDKAAAPEFRDFLTRLHKCTQRLIFVFRVPYLERETLSRIDTAISDVMLVDTVSFVPLSHDKLQQIAAEQLTRYGFTATDGAWDLFRQRLAEEKSDGRFYGTKTVKKVVDEMIFLKFQTILEGGEEDNVIASGDLRGMVSAGTEVSAAERMERLVGVDKIRDRIYEIVGQIEFARKNQGVNAPAMHMRFVGNPGTGKTTIARIVGQLLKERNILSRGYFFEHTGGDFLGMYVGHTSPKTLALCRDAYGSVLFIDEAYTLADASYSNGDGFAKEAIDTLIAQMENHREDLVVIMAGYPKEMGRLMDLNPGLAGRMPYELVFPNYTREELAQIFLRMVAGDGFTCGEGVEDAVKAYFAGLDNSLLEDKNFANARFARNLFERTWSKTVMRAQIDGSDPKRITLADFQSASNEDARAIGAKHVKHSRPGYRLGLI